MTNKEAILVINSVKFILDNDQYSDDVEDALDTAISALAEQRWIPCDETIEIPDHEVLACDKYGEEILGYLEYADEQWICESEDCVMYDPIAWMEKPEPYKEGEQDGEIRN